MKRLSIVGGLLVSFCCGWIAAQSQAPAPVVAITSGDIDAVLKHTGSEGAGTDRQIKVADLGAYRLGVGVLHRGATRPGAPVGAFLAGVAVGRRLQDGPQALEDVKRTLEPTLDADRS